jgi:uncharacterized membrane protein
VTAVFVPGRSEWLLFAHVAAAFVFFGAAITIVVVGIAATRARRAGEAALLARLAYRVDLLVLWPALIVLVGAGAQLASDEDAYSRGWLRWGMTLTAVVVVLAGGLELLANRRRMRAAEQHLATGEDEPERRSSPILTSLGALSLILLVVIFWLMTAKPGFDQ